MTPGAVTAVDLAGIQDVDCRHELVAGRLRTRRFLTLTEGAAGAELAARIMTAVDTGRRRRVVAATGWLLAEDPDTVLTAGVAVVPPVAVDVHESGYPRTPPVLVVDVTDDPADRPSLWIAAGVRLLWVVDAHERLVREYERDGSTRVLREGDVLDGGDVLPGFSVPVADVLDPD